MVTVYLLSTEDCGNLQYYTMHVYQENIMFSVIANFMVSVCCMLYMSYTPYTFT